MISSCLFGAAEIIVLQVYIIRKNSAKHFKVSHLLDYS